MKLSQMRHCELKGMNVGKREAISITSLLTEA